MSDSFIARQTSNLQAMVEAGEIQNKPEQLRSREEKQKLAVQSSPCRCIRCGNLVHPFVALPGPYLCDTCEVELHHADQQKAPGCRWWRELLLAVQNRKQEKSE